MIEGHHECLYKKWPMSIPDSVERPEYIMWEIFEVFVKVNFYLWALITTDEHWRQLNTKRINEMYWPACSPDLNYIKFNLEADGATTGERNVLLTKK